MLNERLSELTIIKMFKENFDNLIKDFNALAPRQLSRSKFKKKFASVKILVQ